MEPKVSSKASYALLSIEIHNCIFELAQQIENLNNDNPLLKTARQVSKRLNEVATPLLFHTIVLYEHADCWQALNNICRTPHLAQHVKRIQLACLEPLPEITKKQYSEEIFNHLWLWNPGTTSSDEVVAIMEITTNEMGERYARYTAWREKEQMMCIPHEAPSAPSLELQLLGPLHIETIGLRQLLVVRRNICDGKARSPENYRYITRRHAETGWEDKQYLWEDCDWLPPHVTHEHADLIDPLEPTYHLSRFMNASKVAGGIITSLTLHAAYELLQQQHDFELPHLQCLTLDILSPNLELEYTAHLYARQPSTWLQSRNLDNLESLSITQYPETKNAVDLVTLLADIQLPSLSYISLVRPETTLAALRRFKSQHLEQVRILRIETPLMKLSEWTEFCAELREATRYSGKVINLSLRPYELVVDKTREDQYWDERRKRPQGRQTLKRLY